MKLPTLYKRTSAGKIQMWNIEVNGRGHTDHYSDGYEVAEIVTTYGQLDGKLQQATDTITQGKNVGKANETTPFEQAQAEAQSQWEKKLKRGYVQKLDDAEAGKIDTNAITGGVSPMLAHRFDQQGHKIHYPAYVQPKLDGHRCIAIIQDGICTLWSRTRKPITGVPHIARALEKMYANVSHTVILDGELYNHDYREKFEELTSFIRQAVPKPGHEVVQYWVYDVVTDGPFSERQAELDGVTMRALGEKVDKVIALATFEVEDEDDLIQKFQVFLDNGYEGAMVRNANGLYKNSRSYDLQKIKTQFDSEFKIVGINEGRGKLAGHAIFECETEGGKTFGVKMKGETSLLKTYFQDHNLWKGRNLVVQYQGLTADGIPRFPVGLRIHEEL